MADLPARPDLGQLRHRAKDLLRAAQRGDTDAVARINAVSSRHILSSAQLALAREYGFASWARLKLEVERRDILNSRDLSRLAALLAAHPELATTRMEHWSDHKSADPVGYLAMLRFDHARLGRPARPTPNGSDCPCTPRRVMAGWPACGGCSPTAPTPISAIPGTTRHRCRNASRPAVQGTAKYRPSSGPSPGTAVRRHLRPAARDSDLTPQRLDQVCRWVSLVSNLASSY